jgi:predicted DCC family thiol-disulfide oxidoreductase YuxK
VPVVSQVLTWATLVVEAALPALLLFPVHSVWVRRLAVVLGLSLHVGFATFINLGVFSASMCCLWLLLVPHEDMTRVMNWLRKGTRGATLYFDSDCGVCGWFARALLCMQQTSVALTPAFTIKGNEAAPRDVPGVTAEQVDASVLWLDDKGGQVWHSNAFAAVASTFPLARPFAWIFKLPFARRAYVAFAQRRHAVSAYFGLGACGLTKAPEPFDVFTDAAKARVRGLARARHGLLLYLFVIFVVQVLAQNRAVPQAIKPAPPVWVEWPVEYLHFYQGWGMFAHSPLTDATVVVRAVTSDGRKVDPLSERASSRSPPCADVIIDRLDHDEFWCDYLSRIADDRAYQPPLREWVLAYPQRTGNPADAIRSFEVVQLTDVSPMPGETEPTQRAQRVVMTYP